MGLKKIALKLLPAWISKPVLRTRANLLDIYAIKSYSQEGEDMILQRIFADKQSGFYVDVGAHHPRLFSNTYFFYKRGWSGLNIEPNPDVIRVFKAERGRDINLQLGISDHAADLTYYCFDEPALNTFDTVLVKSRLATTPYKVVGTCIVQVQRLEFILGKYLPPNARIDFLSIDVEGLDFAVLKSNDWRRFRPACVLVESLETSLEDAMHCEIFLFMKSHGYELFAKTFNTLIFREKLVMDEALSN